MGNLVKRLEELEKQGLSRSEIETAIESVLNGLESLEIGRRSDEIEEYELFHIFG